MVEPDFTTLCAAHVAMLTGSLIGGIDPGPEGCRYVWSASIPDPTLNFALGIRTKTQADWTLAAAEARGRQPAFLARDAQEAARLRHMLAPEAEFAASWMLADVVALAPDAAASDNVSVHAEPPESFCSVFGALSDDARIRAHVERHYVPSLRAARMPADVRVRHLVLHEAHAPAACASLYLRDGLAGLYNVSTRWDRQRRGLGAKITAAALATARDEGARHVVLQCPAGNHAERLYARAGFRTICAPSLICLKAP